MPIQYRLKQSFHSRVTLGAQSREQRHIRPPRTLALLLASATAIALLAAILLGVSNVRPALAAASRPDCELSSEIFPSVEPTVTALLSTFEEKTILPAISFGGDFSSELSLFLETTTLDARNSNVCFTSLASGQTIRGRVGTGNEMGVTAGVLNITVDGKHFYGFCTDLHNPISGGQCFSAPVGLSRVEVACVMQNYPAVGGLTNAEAAARQGAVWFFSDNFVTTSPAGVVTRVNAIVADIQAKRASGQCPDVAIPSLTIEPVSDVNVLESNGAGGHNPSPHPITVTLKIGDDPQVGLPVTVTTSFGNFSGGGTSATGVTDVNGQAHFTVTSSITGTAVLTGSAVITNLTTVRFETSPTAQKLLVNWDQPFVVRGNAIKSWTANSINVRKFHDRNMNGVQDPGEELINWTIRYRELPNGAYTTINLGADGIESIPVDPGKQYEVCEVLREGDWLLTTGSSCYTNLSSGSTVLFGNTDLRAVHVLKFNDLNGNGVRDAGEPGVPNWAFTLFEWSGGVWKQRDTGVTGADGTKGFVGLNVARYAIIEGTFTGWVTTTVPTQEIVFTSSVYTAAVTFGNMQPASITIEKAWEDGGSPGASQPIAVCIERTGGETPVRVMVPQINGVNLVGSGGTWRFCADNVTSGTVITNIWPGTWTVTEQAPTGWFARGSATVSLLGGESETASLTNERPAIDLRANGAVDQGYTWEIGKSVTPPSIDLTPPETGDFTYTVSVTRTLAGRENYRISGSVTMTNTTGQSLNASLSLVEVNSVDADGWECVVPAPLAAGATRTCAFSTQIAPTTIASVVANATFANGAGQQIVFDDQTVVDFAFIPPTPISETITVTDTQVTGSWTFTQTDSTTYVETQDCSDIDFSSSTTGSKTIVNTAGIVETGRHVTATVGVNCTITQHLNGYKSINWNGLTPDTSITFNICAQGPSFPTGTEAGACHLIGWEGGAFTWGNVLPGEYTITETASSPDWVSVPPIVVVVAQNQTTQAVINNSYVPTPTPTNTPTATQTPTSTPTNTPTPITTLTPQPTPTPTNTPTATATPTSTPPPTAIPPTGAIVARKVVDWGAISADASQSFTLCLLGNGFTTQTPGACQSVGFLGGVIAWNSLPPGQYEVIELGLDPAEWDVEGSGAVSVVVGNDRHDMTVTNRNTTPTNDPEVEEPGGWRGFLPWVWSLVSGQ